MVPTARDHDRWIEVTTYPVPAEMADAGELETIVVLRDVTAARQREAIRETFIGVLSHELRTPVTSIYGGAKLLARPDSRLDDATRQSIFEDIVAESERLQRLVEDVVAMNRFGEASDDLGARAGPAPADRPRRRGVRAGALARRRLRRHGPARGSDGRRRPGLRRADAAQPAVQRGEVRWAGQPASRSWSPRPTTRSRSGSSTRGRASTMPRRIGCSTCSTGRRATVADDDRRRHRAVRVRQAGARHGRPHLGPAARHGRRRVRLRAPGHDGRLGGA